MLIFVQLGAVLRAEEEMGDMKGFGVLKGKSVLR